MSVNIISLNQIINLFSNFADRHYFIKDFGYGPTSDIGTSRQMEFPYMWLSLDENSTIVVQNKTAIPQYGITILFMDKINIQKNYLDINGVDSDNSQEVLSDMLQLLQDMITEIEVEWGNYGLRIEGDVNCFPAVDETTDKVNGWVGRFVLRVKHSNCILPTGDIVQTNISPINPYTRYLTCDTLETCEVIQDIQSQLTGITSGLTCDTLSGCSIIQDIQEEINDLQGLQPGLFAQTGNSFTISGTTIEGSLIDGGVGTLSIPANIFKVGDSFSINMGGIISSSNQHSLRLRLKSGSVILADSGFQDLPLISQEVFKLKVDFTIRKTGTTTVADIVTLGTFNYTKKTGGQLLGFSFNNVNNTTFDTTIPNTLDITIEWGQTSNNDKIYSDIFVLTKTY